MRKTVSESELKLAEREIHRFMRAWHRSRPEALAKFLPPKLRERHAEIWGEPIDPPEARASALGHPATYSSTTVTTARAGTTTTAPAFVFGRDP